MSDLAPCPFCANHEVQLVTRKVPDVSRSFYCNNCHVTVRPPAWHADSEADAVEFWNRCRHPGAYTLDPHLVPERSK